MSSFAAAVEDLKQTTFHQYLSWPKMLGPQLTMARFVAGWNSEFWMHSC